MDLFSRQHPLKINYENTSWNNIPLPLKEFLESIVNHITEMDIIDYKRKKKVNERFEKVHNVCDKLKNRTKLLCAESRAQGTFLHEFTKESE